MSIQDYFISLKNKTELSYLQLAKEIGITYQNIMDYKNGNILKPSPKVLQKISHYEGRKTTDILFDIYRKDFNPSFSDSTLKYLCNKINEGYLVKFEDEFPEILTKKRVVKEGVYYKKRVSKQFVIVYSWESIKKEHWNTYKESLQYPYTKDSYSRIFINEDLYLSSVLSYAVQQAALYQILGVTGCDIIFDEDVDIVDYHIANSRLIPTKYIKVQLICI